jgi:hypothetical protein
MKKILSFVLLLGLAGLAQAETRYAPQSPRGQEITADYAGVEYSTINATSFIASTVGFAPIAANTSYTGRQYGVYGVYFSTGVCGDAVQVFTSSSGFDNRNYLTSFYNVSGSTGGQNGLGGVCSGFSGLDKPLYVDGGNLFVRNAVTGYIGNLLLYWKEGN